jgi:predicted O-linked N-acetylglucosamine transferase (SPINDLY family)
LSSALNRVRPQAVLAERESPPVWSSSAVPESDKRSAGPPAADALRGRLEAARAAASRADWARATQLYLEVIQDSPEQLDALEGLGIAALQSQRAAEALEWLTRAREKAPDSVRVLSNLGIAQGRNGQLAAAIESYRRAHELDPKDSRVLINLGRSQREAQQLEDAIATFRRALELSPDAPEIWSMLSNALREHQDFEEAARAARSALAKNPWFGDAHLNEGAALHLAGRLDEALVSYFAAGTVPAARAAALRNLELVFADSRASDPAITPRAALVRRLLRGGRDVSGLVELAETARAERRPAIAILCFERAFEQQPSADLARRLAVLLWEEGHPAAATSSLVKAIELDERHAGSYRLLGDWLARQDPNKYRDNSWKIALERCPDDVQALVNLGAAAQRRGFAIEGARLQRRAIGVDPGCLEAHLNLGSALTEQGLAADAVAVYRDALRTTPKSWPTYSNLLFALHLDPKQSRQAIFDEHLEFGRRLSASVPPQATSFAHDCDPSRRLRIGYVSPDFRNHPVAHFLEPVLRAHDPSAVEVYCYSDVEYPDAVTTRLAGLAPHFLSCVGWRHVALFERILSDRIDILVDLAGHTGRNRLPVFAQRPSPVQVSWLGYFDTSGVPAIDYRIADEHSVSVADEAFFVEKVVRLPRSANCYLPPGNPPLAPAPCLGAGHITFGCFNNPMKVGRDVVAVFAEVLRAVPNSHLLFKYSAFNDPGRRERYLDWFKAEGVSEERIHFEGPSALPQFLEAFGKIDIALDPFPYSGETTALHTLWMGVPLVVLGGPSLVERLASRVLAICGRREWITGSRADYVRVAVDLARDPERLDRLRSELRRGLEASPLLDHAGVTRELEAAYREMWQRWCRSRG